MSEQPKCTACGGDGYRKGPRLGDEQCPSCTGTGATPHREPEKWDGTNGMRCCQDGCDRRADVGMFCVSHRETEKCDICGSTNEAHNPGCPEHENSCASCGGEGRHEVAGADTETGAALEERCIRCNGTGRDTPAQAEPSPSPEALRLLAEYPHWGFFFDSGEMKLGAVDFALALDAFATAREKIWTDNLTHMIRGAVDEAVSARLKSDVRVQELEAALLGCANIAHLAWTSAATIRPAFERIEEIARAALAKVTT